MRQIELNMRKGNCRWKTERSIRYFKYSIPDCRWCWLFVAGSNSRCNWIGCDGNRHRKFPSFVYIWHHCIVWVVFYSLHFPIIQFENELDALALLWLKNQICFNGAMFMRWMQKVFHCELRMHLKLFEMASGVAWQNAFTPHASWTICASNAEWREQNLIRHLIEIKTTESASHSFRSRFCFHRLNFKRLPFRENVHLFGARIAACEIFLSLIFLSLFSPFRWIAQK